jgi:hypothetical protein
VNRLRKYVERTAGAQELRVAYAMTVTALPDRGPRAQWREISPFSAADEVLSDPALKTAFKTAIERGFAILPKIELKAKGQVEMPIGPSHIPQAANAQRCRK